MTSIRQVKAARALLDWSQGKLALASGVSEPTIARLESSDGPIGGRTETGEEFVTALEKAGVEVMLKNGGDVGKRMVKRAKRALAKRQKRLASRLDIWRFYGDRQKAAHHFVRKCCFSRGSKLSNMNSRPIAVGFFECWRVDRSFKLSCLL